MNDNYKEKNLLKTCFVGTESVKQTNKHIYIEFYKEYSDSYSSYIILVWKNRGVKGGSLLFKKGY